MGRARAEFAERIRKSHRIREHSEFTAHLSPIFILRQACTGIVAENFMYSWWHPKSARLVVHYKACFGEVDSTCRSATTGPTSSNGVRPSKSVSLTPLPNTSMFGTGQVRYTNNGVVCENSNHLYDQSMVQLLLTQNAEAGQPSGVASVASVWTGFTGSIPDRSIMSPSPMQTTVLSTAGRSVSGPVSRLRCSVFVPPVRR